MAYNRSYFAGPNRTSPYYYRGISLIGQQTSPRSLIFTTPFVDIPTSAVLAVVVHLLPLVELSNTGVRILASAHGTGRGVLCRSRIPRFASDGCMSQQRMPQRIGPQIRPHLFLARWLPASKSRFRKLDCFSIPLLTAARAPAHSGRRC